MVFEQTEKSYSLAAKLMTFSMSDVALAAFISLAREWKVHLPGGQLRKDDHDVTEFANGGFHVQCTLLAGWQQMFTASSLSCVQNVHTLSLCEHIMTSTMLVHVYVG